MKQKQRTAAIGIVLILVFLAMAFFLAVRNAGSIRAAGQAVSIGGERFEGIINLLEEETAAFTALPDETGREFTLRTGIDPYDEAPMDYLLRIFRLDEQNYAYSIAGEVEQDIIIAGETIPIYLNDDLVADLEFSFRQGALQLKNLHFLPPDRAAITLRDASGNELPRIVRLVEGVRFTASIHAESGSAAPELSVSTGEISNIQRIRNTAAADFSFFPAEEGAAALDITANVRGQLTRASYLFLAGNEAYRLEQAAFPLVLQRFAEDTGNNARLVVQFRDTEQLQPLAFPCRPAQRNLDQLFANTAVRQLLTYGGEETQVWAAGDIPDTFSQLEDLRGYFVKLQPGAAPAQRELNAECTVQAVFPAQEPPSEGSQLQPFAFEKGWTLFALPGVAHQALSSFTDAPFRIFSCAQNYVCEELGASALLEPGKPYWVFAEEKFSISMRRE